MARRRLQFEKWSFSQPAQLLLPVLTKIKEIKAAEQDCLAVQHHPHLWAMGNSAQAEPRWGRKFTLVSTHQAGWRWLEIGENPISIFEQAKAASKKADNPPPLHTRWVIFLGMHHMVLAPHIQEYIMGSGASVLGWSKPLSVIRSSTHPHSSSQQELHGTRQSQQPCGPTLWPSGELNFIKASH